MKHSAPQKYVYLTIQDIYMLYMYVYTALKPKEFLMLRFVLYT